jgi:hypothetical protein
MAGAGRVETIYVELDTLLDTRLGTIAKINPEIAELLANTDYQTRKEDKFEGVDSEAFKLAYSTRDEETLELSVVTNMIEFLSSMTVNLTEQGIVRPYHDGAKVVVNYYPYILSVEVRDELVAVISKWLNGLVPVEVVYITPAELTIGYCKECFSIMIMYDYLSWMNARSEEFITQRIDSITLYGPAIYFNDMPDTKELEKVTTEVMHPLKAMEFLASPLVGLRLIDISFFSVITKKITA